MLPVGYCTHVDAGLVSEWAALAKSLPGLAYIPQSRTLGISSPPLPLHCILSATFRKLQQHGTLGRKANILSHCPVAVPLHVGVCRVPGGNSMEVMRLFWPQTQRAQLDKGRRQ
jgi:hypothetical protein